MFHFQQASNQDMGGFSNNRKRLRESDNFNMPQKDFDEFRPMQVIDYQNKAPNQPPFGGQTSFPGPNTLNVLRPDIIFPRKIIEYNHKTKVHQWNWFCPVVQIEYNHTKTGLSLHEHPPPKPIKKDLPQQPYRAKQEQQQRGENQQLRQQKWPQAERQERLPYVGQNERQPRFENRPTQQLNNQQSNENQSYYRRQPQEKNWSRNYRDWNAAPPNYGYER